VYLGEAMAVKAASIFLAAQVDPQVYLQTVFTPAVKLTAVAVNNYAEAVKVCQALLAEGLAAFELCGGFGNIGAGMIAEALEGKQPLVSSASMVIPVSKVRAATNYSINTGLEVM
jgi:hypothetical protein